MGIPATAPGCTGGGTGIAFAAAASVGFTIAYKGNVANGVSKRGITTSSIVGIVDVVVVVLFVVVDTTNGVVVFLVVFDVVVVVIVVDDVVLLQLLMLLLLETFFGFEGKREI